MQEMQEKWVGSMGLEDPLEEEKVTHSSILAWKVPWAGEPGGLQSIGSPRVGQLAHKEQLTISTQVVIYLQTFFSYRTLQRIKGLH